MTNREKYAKELLNVACTGKKIAIDKRTMQIRSCAWFECVHCLLNEGDDCGAKLSEWAESEYIEQPKISKKDRAFLDYIRDVYNFVVRDKEGKLFIYSSKPYKNYDGAWIGWGKKYGLRCFDVELPMVKWSDSEPWSIEDLNKLEVVDSYE